MIIDKENKWKDKNKYFILSLALFMCRFLI